MANGPPHASNPQSKPKPTITIRAATPADAAQIATLGAAVFTASFGHSVSPSALQTYLSESYSPEAMEADIRDPKKTMILATTSWINAQENEEDEILGFALLTRGTTDPCLSHLPQITLVELQRIYVSTSAHGMGIGSSLAKHLETVAREEGYVNMWLGVWEENLVAQGVYGRLGYGRVGSHDFVMGEVRQTDWIMVKGL